MMPPSISSVSVSMVTEVPGSSLTHKPPLGNRLQFIFFGHWNPKLFISGSQPDLAISHRLLQGGRTSSSTVQTGAYRLHINIFMCGLQLTFRTKYKICNFNLLFEYCHMQTVVTISPYICHPELLIQYISIFFNQTRSVHLIFPDLPILRYYLNSVLLLF
jgi:hypothetical protein